MRRQLAAGLTLLMLSGIARGVGTEREMFDRAEKVVLGKVVHLGATEDAPGSTKARPYHYQRWWVRDGTLLKGPAAPARRGYEVILAPIGRHHRSPSSAFAALQTITDLPPDEEVLLYLVKDQFGAWTLLDGRDGFFRYPGRTRIEQLKTWSRAAGVGGKIVRRR